MSRRNSALRLPASNPWQGKQVSAKMGRMSRLNRTGALVLAAKAATEQPNRKSIPVPRSTRRTWLRTIRVTLRFLLRTGRLRRTACAHAKLAFYHHIPREVFDKVKVSISGVMEGWG